MLVALPRLRYESSRTATGTKDQDSLFCKPSHPICGYDEGIGCLKLDYSYINSNLLTDYMLVVNVAHRSYIPRGHGGCAQFPRPFLAGAKLRGWARD